MSNHDLDKGENTSRQNLLPEPGTAVELGQSIGQDPTQNFGAPSPQRGDLLSINARSPDIQSQRVVSDMRNEIQESESDALSAADNERANEIDFEKDQGKWDDDKEDAKKDFGSGAPSAIVRLDTEWTPIDDSAKLGKSIAKSKTGTIRVSTTAMEEEDISEERARELDPIQHLSPIEQIEANDRIASAQICKFDRTLYTQVLANPLAGEGTIEKEEIITVQLVRPVLSLRQETDTKEMLRRDLYQQCSYSSSKERCFVEYCESTPDKRPKHTKCSLCNETLSRKQSRYQCPNQKHEFRTCLSCTLDHFVRRKIENGSTMNKKYDRYVLKHVSDLDKDNQDKEQAITDDAEEKRIAELIKSEASTRNGDPNKVSSSLFAELNQENDEYLKTQKHAIVSFWKKYKDFDQMVCYQSIRIDNALYMIPKSEEGLNVKNLLHVGQNKELFFFSKEKQNDKEFIHLNMLDIVSVCSKQGLKPINSLIYYPKLLGNPIVFQDEHSASILKYIFGRLSHRSHQRSKLSYKTTAPFQLAEPQLIKHCSNGQTYLVLVTNYAKRQFSSTNRFDNTQEFGQLEKEGAKAREYVETDYRNLYFIRLDQNPQVEFVIYNANLFMQLTQSEDKVDHVWFIRDKSMVVMEWGSPAQPKLCETQPKEKGKGEYKVPLQIFLKQYMFSPAESKPRYQQSSNDLLNRFQHMIDKKYMMSGRVHYNKKRITIIFMNGAVFSFQLTECAPQQNSVFWAGSIGLNNGYVINLNQWIDQNNFTGHWQLADDKDLPSKAFGQFDYSGCSWAGYISSKSQKDFIFFDNFSLKKSINHETKLQIQGNGKHGNGYSYQVEGEIDQTTLKAQFVEVVYHQGQLKEKLQFEGTYCPLRFQIQGKINGQHTFNLQMQTNKNAELMLRLTSRGGKEEIMLRGKYNVYGSYFKGVTQIPNEESGETENLKFHFQSINSKFRAQTWLLNLAMDDAQFSIATDNSNSKSLFLCGNIREHSDEHSEQTYNGFNPMRIDLIDLDQNVELAAKPKAQVQAFQRSSTLKKGMQQNGMTEFANRISTLEFLLPSFFYQIMDERGNLKLPAHYLLPFDFKITRETDGSAKVIGNLFNGQMFFKDPLTKKMQLIYLQGSQKEKNDKLAIPCWPSSQSEDVIVRYPILAYKTQLPQNQEIVFVNLVTNEPQKILNIEPFKFVQFIEQGFNPERYLVENPSEANLNTCIFFLVENQGIFRIMYYKCFPYPLNQPKAMETQGFQTNDCVRILNGHFNLSQKPDIAPRFTQEKIMKACLLQRPQLEGVQMMCVLQLNDAIFTFSLNDDDKFDEFSNDSKESMIKILMLRGPFEEIYYAEKNFQTGDQIIRLTYKSKDKLTRESVKKFGNAEILGLTLVGEDEFDAENFKKHSIIVLDDEGVYQQLSFQDQDSDAKQVMSFNIISHDRFHKIEQYLRQNPWSTMVGNKRGLSVIQDVDDNSNAQTFMIHSAMVNSHKPLSFVNDSIFNKMSQKRTFRGKEEVNVNSVKSIPWVNKCIFEIRDHNYSYFLVRDSIFTKKRDLMSVDMTKRLEGEKQKSILGNEFIVIPTQGANQSILFNQGDLQFSRTLMYKKLEPFGDPESDGTQFLLATHSDANDTEMVFSIYRSQPPRIEEYFEVGQMYHYYLKQVKKILNQVYVEYKLNESHYEQKFCVHSYPKDQEKLLFITNAKIPERKEDQNKFEQEMKEQQAKMKKFFSDAMDLVDDKEKYPLTGETLNIIVKRLEVGHQKSFGILLNTNEFPTDGKDAPVYLTTQDYLVINCLGDFYFHDLKEIMTGERKKLEIDITNLQNIQELNLLDQMENLGSGVFDNNDCYRFKKVNIRKNFNENTVSAGMTIRNVNSNDLDIAERNEERKNVIQISFESLSMLWDLDENKEVTFIENPKQLLNFNNYARTGTIPHLFTFKKEMKHAKFLQQNGDCNLFIQPARSKSTSSHIFKSYSSLDICDVRYIQQCEIDDIFVKKIDYDTILADFQGLTFFQIFKENNDYMERIATQIRDDELKSKTTIDLQGNETDNIIIRRMFWTLMQTYKDEDPKEIQKKLKKRVKALKKGNNQPKIINNILTHKLCDENGQFMLDSLLDILMNSNEFKLSNLVANFDAFKTVFSTNSSAIREFMSNSLFENDQTIDVKAIRWDKTSKIVTFGSNTSQLSPEIIKQRIEQKQIKKIKTSNLKKLIRAFTSKAIGFIKGQKKDRLNEIEKQELMRGIQTIPVKVKILEVEWLSDSLSDLYVHMAKQDDIELFGNDFIKILLEQNAYHYQIFFKVFIFYALYAFTCIYYFSDNIVWEKPTAFFSHDYTNNAVALRSIIAFVGCAMVIVELLQLKRLKYAWFEDAWNYIMMFSYILNGLILFDHVYHFLDWTRDQMIGWTSFAVCLQWFVFYYWFRLVPSLAFFVTFLQEVIYDISGFVVMFFVCILMFGNMVYIISESELESFGEAGAPDDYKGIIASAFGNQFYDSLFQQYQITIGMGELNFENKVLVWFSYLATTLFTQLTFFNMLISIMGQSFERISEQAEPHSLMERTRMYADFLWAIKLDDEIADMRYLYVITPEQEEEDTGVENSIGSVKRQLAKLEKGLSRQLENQAKRITGEVADFQVTALNQLNEKTDEVAHMIKEFSKKFTALEQNMKKQ